MLISPVKLAIVDDHTLFRQALKNYLLQQPKLEVSILASGVSDLLYQMKETPADIVLTDVFMPHLSGYDALKAIRDEHPNVKIIILSMCTDLHLINNLMDVGIHGYISKADEPEELLQAIHAVANQKIYRNKLFTEALYLNKQNDFSNGINKEFSRFNEREKKVLQLLWKEKSNKDIAEELFLSIRSIEKIRQDMKEKLGVKTTIGLLKYGLKSKVIGNEEMIAADIVTAGQLHPVE